MSHILDNKMKFSCLSEIVERASSKSIDTTMLENDLKTLIPKDVNNQLLVDTNITEKGLRTAIYIVDRNCIKASADKVEAWVQSNTDSLKNKFFIKDVELFRGYLYLNLLVHEVEHSYQEHIALGNVNLTNPVIQGAYYHILKYFKKDNSIFPKPISKTRKALKLYNYRKRENEYVLERNASLEGYDLLYRLANNYKNEEMARAFYCCRTLYCKLGYHDSPKGSFAETYQAMLMAKKYDEVIGGKLFPEEEAVRYGLPVSEETRQKILTL